MERVAFLIEETGERIGCLLNPEDLVIRRQAGVQARKVDGGLVTGADLADDQLLYSGGGNTELSMRLIFDVSIAGSSAQTNDVRDLTGPIWRLAETANTPGGYQFLPYCRFVWGKFWNLYGLIIAVAERFEKFTQDGAPRRSWMSLLFRRVMEPSAHRPSGPSQLGNGPGRHHQRLPTNPQVESHIAVDGERPDQVAQRCYRDPGMTHALMAFNNIDDPLNIPAGTFFEVPPLNDLE